MQTTETVPVTITTSDFTMLKVCMSPDQNDYGTGRCGFSFMGTVVLAGMSASLGDITASWVMNQIATVRMGTPDC